MARHFKEMPEKTHAPRQTTRKSVRSGDTSSLPYGEAASYRYSYPTAVRTDDYYYDGDDESSGGLLQSFGRGVLLLVSWVLRLPAIALFALVMLNSLSIYAIEPYVTRVTDAVTTRLPLVAMLPLSVDTPFGGTFRGELALLSLLFFVLDWLVCRMRARLR